MKQNKIRYVPAKKEGRFECAVHEVKEGFLFGTASLLIRSCVSRINPWKKEVVDWYNPEVPVERSQELVVTWIGHATVLVQVAGINILIDPIFGNSSILYPRIMKPGIPLENLPPIDLVLISHNHMDHMEDASIRALARRHKGVRFFVPQGDKAWFAKRNINAVTESMWWQSHRFGNTSISCTFLPAVHWTQRWLFDRNRSLWGSWLIKAGDKSVYFAGDTAYGKHFADIAAEFPSIDIAILPIGPCEPREFMKHAHMNADEAAQAFGILQAHHFIPIHWGTFRFGNEAAYLPIERLKQAWNQENFKTDTVLHIPKAGQKIIID